MTEGGSVRRTPPAAVAAIIVAVCLAAVVLAAAVAVLAFSLAGMDHDGIYDDPAAIAGGNSYSAVGFAQTRVNGRLSGHVSRLSGVYELDTCQMSEEDTAALRYTLEVSDGKAKLVLVAPDGEVTTLAECLAGESGQDGLVLTLKEGTSRLKLVAAEDAALSWQIEWN